MHTFYLLLLRERDWERDERRHKWGHLRFCLILLLLYLTLMCGITFTYTTRMKKKMGLHDTVYHYAALLLIKYVERRKINKKLSKFISISIFMRSCLCIAYHHRQFDTDTKTLWFFFFPFSSNLATIKRVKIQKYLFIRKLTFVPREIYQLLWGKTKIHLLKTGAQEEEERETDEFRVLNTRTSKFIIEK